MDLRKTHGAGRADGRVPLAPSARQMPKGREEPKEESHFWATCR